MRALFGVNGLLAAFDEGHIWHHRLRNWWSQNANAGWATCPLTENGFVRIMSQPSYANRRPLRHAAEVLRLGVRHQAHEFWPDDISIHDDRIFDHARILGPSQITDVYLLALAVKNGGRLVTFDRSIPIAAVRGAEARNLVVPG